VKQRPRLRRTHQLRQRFSLGDFVMPSHNPLQPGTIVVCFKFFDSGRAIAAAFPVVEEFIQQLKSLQQQQQITQFQPSAEITLKLRFHGCEQAIATVTQIIENSVYQLEQLRQAKYIAQFEAECEILE